MALVTMKEMLEDAKRRRYAVGAFNVLNIESLPVSYTHLTLPTN